MVQPIIVWLAIILEFVESMIEYSDHETGPGNSDMADVGCLILLQFLNVFVGFMEELKADEAIKALKQSLLPSVSFRPPQIAPALVLACSTTEDEYFLGV